MTVIDAQATRVDEPPELLPNMDTRPYVRLGLLVLLVVFGIFGGWAAFAPLESAVVTAGEIKVEARRKVLQHLEGGIVSEILVEDSDYVEAGQVLLRLSDIDAKARLRITRLQQYATLAHAARLKAERDDLPTVEFPEILTAAADEPEVQEMIAGERHVFEARRNSRRNETHILEQRIEQLRNQILGVEGMLGSEETRIESYREEIEEWALLYERKLADKLRLIQLKREAALLHGEHASQQARLAELRLEIGETESEILLREQTFLSEVTSKLREAQTELADLATRILAMEDTLSRTELRASVSGVIVELRVRTIGAVISPGEPILELVPSSDKMVILVRISPIDIDNVHSGQAADIRFTAFDQSETHVVSGELSHVSADAIQDAQTGMSYFEGQVRPTAQGQEQMRVDGITLLPGMPAEALIKTGGRTLLNYLLKPFLDMLARTFRES